MGFPQQGTYQNSWYERDTASVPRACTGHIVYITVRVAGTGDRLPPSRGWEELQLLAEGHAAAKTNTRERATDDRRVCRRAPPVAFEWSGAKGHPTRPARGRDAVVPPQDLRPTARSGTPPMQAKPRARERKCPPRP